MPTLVSLVVGCMSGKFRGMKWECNLLASGCRRNKEEEKKRRKLPQKQTADGRTLVVGNAHK